MIEIDNIYNITPKANGGNLGVDNLRFVSWFENRAKNDIPIEKWEEMKKDIIKYL